MAEEQLLKVFLHFAAFGKGQEGASDIDSAKFVKIAKDCGLVDKKLTTTDLDLIFTKVKGAGLKRIDFVTFTTALQHIAAKKHSTYEQIVAQVVAAGGPSLAGTTLADAVRFHDDQSTYTGVHQHGGPTTIDNAITLCNLADRSDADVRGVKAGAPLPATSLDVQRIANGVADVSIAGTAPKASPRRPSAAAAASDITAPAAAAAPATAAKQLTPRSSITQQSQQQPTAAAAATAAPLVEQDLDTRVADVWVAFCSSVAKQCTEADSARFLKLCSDSGLIDARMTRTQCDLIFTRAATMKRMSWNAFRERTVAMIAEQKGISEEAVLQIIAATPYVSSSGTVAEAVRFHDDISTYTGVHSAGGPTTTDKSITLSNLADRSSANVRGVKLDADEMIPAAIAANYNAPSPARATRATTPTRASAGTNSTSSFSDDRRRSSGSVAGMAVAPMPSGASKSASPVRRDSSSASGSRKSSLAAAGGTIAGSANRSGGVYDRLSNASSYTGVYAERFKGGPQGGRINGDTINCGPTGFSGSTNSGGDHIVRDISQICRR